jgi:cytidylate kinase
LGPNPKIAIVGPCASGKSTLAANLRQAGWNARQIAQEHSYVADMWQVLTQPDLLVFLNASYEVCTQRKQLNWTPAEYEEQQRRLRHARAHCDVYVDSSDLTPGEVARQVAAGLSGRQPQGDGV